MAPPSSRPQPVFILPFDRFLEPVRIANLQQINLVGRYLFREPFKTLSKRAIALLFRPAVEHAVDLSRVGPFPAGGLECIEAQAKVGAVDGFADPPDV